MVFNYVFGVGVFGRFCCCCYLGEWAATPNLTKISTDIIKRVMGINKEYDYKNTYWPDHQRYYVVYVVNWI